MQFIAKITLFFLFNTFASYSYAYESSGEEVSGEEVSEDEDNSIIQKIIVIICKKYEDKASAEENNAVIAVYDPTNGTHNFLIREIDAQTPDNEFMEIMKNLGISEPEYYQKLKLGTNAFYFVRDNKISVRDMTAKNPHKFSCKNPVVAINVQDILKAIDNGLIQNSYELTSRTNNIKITFNLTTIELIKQNFNDIKNQFDKMYSF